MKKIAIIITILSMVSVHQINSQEKIDCDLNFKNALGRLYYSDNKKEIQNEILRLLKPCVKLNNDNAQLLLGKYYSSFDDEESRMKGFKLIKKSAKNGNPIAMAELGTLYKYGIGCNLNFNKARHWFKKGAKLKDDKSSYSLGYLYLKGFGNITQNYNKAVKWFKNSEHPMAKYWLGICYYYGYGVVKDVDKANELLGTKLPEISFKEISDKDLNNNGNDASNILATETNKENYSLKNDDIIGKWRGLFLKYDWSGKFLEQKIPIFLEFNLNEENELLYSFQLNEMNINGKVLKVENTLIFDELKPILPYNSFHDLIPTKVAYEIISGDFKSKTISGNDFLVGNIDSYIEQFKEPSAPVCFVLNKIETFSNTGEEVSNLVLEALAKQEESFIKVYPNSFQNDLIISYNLEKDSEVSITITDMYGVNKSQIVNKDNQKKGKQTFFYNGNNLQKGIYLVNIFVNDRKETKIIIKK